MTVRVLVVDDQALVRQGIRALLTLSDAVEVVGDAADGRQALAAIDAHDPNVVLLDLRMPVLDGLGVLSELSTRPSAPRVIVLTTFRDDDAFLAAAGLGARGLMLKDADPEELVAAMCAAHAGAQVGYAVLTDSLPKGSLGAGGSFEAAPEPQPLSAREQQILQLLAGGFSNREIAAAVHLPVGTVKNHVSTILLKLGVRDRTRAVLRAYELGIVGSDA